MKRYTVISIIAAVAALVLLPCCRKTDGNSSTEALVRYFESWLAAYHPDARPIGDNGVYILEETVGEGDDWPGAGNFAIVDYTLTELDGTVTGTSEEKVAKRIGSYKKSNYYGEMVWYVNEGSYGVPAGIAEGMEGMKVGGTRTLAIPSWMMTRSRMESKEQYLKENSSSLSHSIYIIKLNDFTDDIEKRQADIMSAYCKEHLHGADSTEYEEGKKYGFYFDLVKANPEGKSIPSDSTVYINYTGRLLNGLVFDTTEADTAKVYNIYNSSKTYKPVPVSWGESYTDLLLDGSETVSGFSAALFKMHPFEKAVTVFYSTLGYGASSMGNAIPSFSPLRFDVELVEKP